jgi:hypothetical protein
LLSDAIRFYQANRADLIAVWTVRQVADEFVESRRASGASASYVTNCEVHLKRFTDRVKGSYVDFTERVAQFEADPAAVIPLPATGMRKSGDGPNVRAVIRAGDGLTWDKVRIEVGATRTILLKAPGQTGKYVLPPNSQMQPDHPLGMLMRLAADGEWRNPPLGSAEYERVSRRFRRLRKLLMALVPLPGDPFQPHRGAFVPVFLIGVNRGLLPENIREP